MTAKSFCSWAKLGPGKGKAHRSRRSGGNVEREELTEGNFVAETQEGILVRRIAPPTVHVGRYLRWHLEAVCGKAGGGGHGR
jgi:hypothetical protein